MCDVLVIGTGTIGTPLIGLLQKQRESLGIGEILMHKRTPQSETTPTIQRLIDHGAKLVVEPEAEGVFRQHGLLPAMMRNDALAQAEVVVDCTPAGNAHKDGVPDGEASWFRPYEGNVTRFIAQGSETGFGVPYALGINDGAIIGQQWVQVVSCNTHNGAVIFDTLRELPGLKIEEGELVLIRRSGDVSQQRIVGSTKVDKHSDDVCGTHHARDVRRVFETLGVQAPIISSSLQIPTMLMHTLRFSFRVSGDIPSRETVLEAFRERALLATSEYQYASEVFSAARDQGFNGRLLEQTVVVAPTVAVIGDRIVGFCFTPQDGNSLLSSVAAIVEDIDPEGWWDRMANFQKWQFGRV